MCQLEDASRLRPETKIIGKAAPAFLATQAAVSIEQQCWPGGAGPGAGTVPERCGGLVNCGGGRGCNSRKALSGCGGHPDLQSFFLHKEPSYASRVEGVLT